MNQLEQIKAHLAGIKEREDAASEGPWTSDEKWIEKSNKRGPSTTIGSCDGYGREKNAAFIAASRTDIPRLRAALECAVDALEVCRDKSEIRGYEGGHAGIESASSSALTQILTILQPA